jgi:hypothetical protein
MVSIEGLFHDNLRILALRDIVTRETVYENEPSPLEGGLGTRHAWKDGWSLSSSHSMVNVASESKVEDGGGGGDSPIEMLDDLEDIGLLVRGIGSIRVVDRVTIVVSDVLAALRVVTLDRPDHVAQVTRLLDRREVVRERHALTVRSPVVLANEEGLVGGGSVSFLLVEDSEVAGVLQTTKLVSMSTGEELDVLHGQS